MDDEVGSFIQERDDRPGLRLFRNFNLFGHVTFIKENNKLLEITINRERLIENEAFLELRHFIRLGIDFSTIIYSNFVYKNEKAKKEQILREREALARAEEEAIRLAEEERKKAEEAIRFAEEERKKAEERSRKAEEERRKAEEERRKAEEERRKAEENRRAIEHAKPKEKLNEDNDLKEKLRKAKMLEEEKFKDENWKKTIEKKRIQEEDEARKKLEEERKKMEDILIRGSEERKKNDEKLHQLHKNKLEKSEEAYNRELSQLRVLASTGTLILVFQHELRAIITDMDDIIRLIQKLISGLGTNEAQYYEQEIDSYKDRVILINEFCELLDLSASEESRLEKRPWALRQIVESVAKGFKWYIKENDIDFSYDTIEEDLRVPDMYKSELSSILHNLMTNAFKAIQSEPDRRVEIRGSSDEITTHIFVLDSGKGLKEELWNEVFEPFISYSEPSMRFGSGTGLGLYIVRDIIESYNGIIRFVKPPENWKTCIEVIFPRS